MRLYIILVVCLINAFFIASCNKQKVPNGIYRSEPDHIGQINEIDFQSGGTGHHKLLGGDGPFEWSISGDVILIEQKESKSGGALKWDGDDLILLGPNMRFKHATKK